MSFVNKVVIVTGGSSGIGAATAVLFAKQGAAVAIVGRNEAKLNDVAQQITKLGQQVLIIKADVSNDAEVKTIVKKTIDKFGKLDVLVNNAGLARIAAIDDESLLEVYDLIMNTNLRSIFALTNLATPHLVKTKGNIVNISSVAGSGTLKSFAASGNAVYCTSKAALDHFSRLAAMELAPKGVRVNTVSPGPVETSILDYTGQDVNWEAIQNITALKVISKPEEIAEVILFLSSDKGRCITGSNYVIDGGSLVN